MFCFYGDGAIVLFNKAVNEYVLNVNMVFSKNNGFNEMLRQ